MMRIILILVAALLVVPGAAVAAQKLYKWVDGQGNVSYHDRPPAPDSGYRVEEKRVENRGEGSSEGDANEAAQKFPVVLYTVPKCASCDNARTHLQKRKVPFTEKNAESDVKVQTELKAKAGAMSVPTILVGSKVMNGYMDGFPDGELDQAGYPKLDPAKPAEKPAEDSGFKAPTQ